MTITYKSRSFEIKDFDDDTRIVEGYASAFGFPADSVGDVLAPGSFKSSLARINSEGIPLLDTHVANGHSVLGTIFQAWEDDYGLYIRAKLADTPLVEEIRQKLLQGHLNKFSVGFYIKDSENERTESGDIVQIIKDTELMEVSVVPIPANARASIVSVKSGKEVAEEKTAQTEDKLPNYNDLLIKYLYLKGNING